MKPVSPARVRKAWEYRSEGQVWRILPSGAGSLLGEDREPLKKQVSFFCIIVKDGSVAWEGLTLNEPWWVSMEAVAGGLLLLHEYSVPSMPDHKKIFAVDITTGKPVWTNEELTFSFAMKNSIYASRDLYDRRLFYELDPATGVPLREVDIATVHNLQKTVSDSWEPPFALPSPGTELPGSVRKVLAGAEIRGNPEFLEFGPVRVFSCFEIVRAADTPDTLREHLFVVGSKDDALLFHDVVCDGLALPVPAGFFRMDDMLYYVKEKTRLSSVSLL